MPRCRGGAAYGLPPLFLERRMRVVRCFLLILDAAFLDPFRAASNYKKHPLSMKWKDFWELAK